MLYKLVVLSPSRKLQFIIIHNVAQTVVLNPHHKLNLLLNIMLI